MTKNLVELRKTIRKWLHLEDIDFLDILLACCLDRRLKGDPLWLFVIDSPSGGKTELLRALGDNQMFYQLSSLTTNSFVTGYTYTEKKKTKKVEDLATQLDGMVLVMKDFTSVLAMNKEKRDEIIGQLREFYDGSYSKKMGTIDKKIKIHSSFGLIAGVTPKIDRFYKLMGELGERFLKVRPLTDENKMLEKAISNQGDETLMRNQMKRAFETFFNEVKTIDVKISDYYINQIKSASKFLARMRAGDNSRWEGDNIVEFIPPAPEKPTRIALQLIKLTKALCIIYGYNKPNDSIMEKIWRIVFDSCPQDRLKIYRYCYENDKTSLTEISFNTKIPETSASRILNFLMSVNLLQGKKDWSTSMYSTNFDYNPLCKSWEELPRNKERYRQTYEEINKGEVVDES